MRKRKQEKDFLDWLLLAAAVSLAAVILYYGAGRWRGESVVLSAPPPPPRRGPAAAQPLAAPAQKDPPGVSPSFRAVGSIPPMVLSRTGRPSVHTKAPPAPRTVPDEK